MNFNDLCKGVLSKQNHKLRHLGSRLNLKVVSFDLPAGFTCPAAFLCQTYANRKTGVITHGKNAIFNCYASVTERIFKNTRIMRWNNLTLTRNLKTFESVINEKLSYGKIGVMRIHASGDLYNENYFNAWLDIAESNPTIKFFGYTKESAYAESIQLNYNNGYRKNLNVVYSMGGTPENDLYAIENELQTCTVITPDMKISNDGKRFLNPFKTQYWGVNIWESIACNDIYSDDYDYIMYMDYDNHNGESFGIELHSTQDK